MNSILIKCWLAFVFVVTICTKTEAQEVIASTGNILQNNTGSLTFTIGELCIDTRNNGNISLTQGFHQPKITVTAIGNIAEQYMVMNVFPNPASDLVTLKIAKEKILHFKFRLYDLNGKIITGDKITKPETIIPLFQLPQGNYLLIISENDKPLQTFKIIKN